MKSTPVILNRVMPRFFCNLPPSMLDPASAVRVSLDPDEAHHARKVLRLGLGEEVELFNGQGVGASGVLESWSQGATVLLKELRRSAALSPILDVGVAVPKGPRADDMVNQLGQVGADRLIPLRTSRSVVDPGEAKIEKFARASLESAKQSGRDWVMAIDPVTRFDAVLRKEHDLRLIADPGPGQAGPTELAKRLGAAKRVLILIGPEGGWTPEELRLARESGCVSWRFGPYVLRIETAAVAAAAIARQLTLPQ